MREFKNRSGFAGTRTEISAEKTAYYAAKAWEHYLWLYDNFFFSSLDEETCAELESAGSCFTEAYAEHILSRAAEVSPENVAAAGVQMSMIPAFPDAFFFPLRFMELHGLLSECEQIVSEFDSGVLPESTEASFEGVSAETGKTAAGCEHVVFLDAVSV